MSTAFLTFSSFGCWKCAKMPWQAHNNIVSSSDLFDSQAMNAVLLVCSHNPKANIVVGVVATRIAEI